MRVKRVVTFSLGIVILASIGWSGLSYVQSVRERRAKVLEQTVVERPSPVDRHIFSEESEQRFSVRSSINWKVPFTPQAPDGNWDEVHKEACEEASILMVIRYFRDQHIVDARDAEIGLQNVLSRNEVFGYGVDTTAAEVARVIRSLAPELSVSLLHDPTVDDIKDALRSGSLLIAPVHGQMLGNPYFRSPGPVYHMLVIRGFTDDGYVITNDPGTKRGRAFVYSWGTMMNAIHDWNGGDVENGQKVLVVVGEHSQPSASSGETI